MTKTICDLPQKLVGEKILSKVPITSLREVRSTCKLWNRLSKNWIVGKAAARRHQFLGFMTMDFKVCSLRFHLCRKEEKEDSVDLGRLSIIKQEDSVDLDLSIKEVDLLNQIEISKVFHCDGLLLCVAMDNSKLVAWNPYLGQTRSISPKTDFHGLDTYLFGYDMNHNHKILRFIDEYCLEQRKGLFRFEIYNFSSNSWRDLEVRPDWKVEPGCRGVSLKGNTYFWAQEKMKDGIDEWDDEEDFILCFDFTTERFGQRLDNLPFHNFSERTVTLSSVRDEKLALLHQKGSDLIEALEIWITNKIEEPNAALSWSKFMDVDMRPLIGDRAIRFDENYGSFFIDEEEKVAVVFDMEGYEYCYELVKTTHYHTAFIIGDDGYYKTVTLGVAPDLWKGKPGNSGYSPQIYSPPLVCSSSYLPSLVQLNKLGKRKERDE